MKKAGSVLWGIVLIAAGVIWALNEFNVTNINVFFDGWWTLFIIVPCAIGLFTEREKTGNIIGTESVADDEQIMIITTEGIVIRTSVNSIPVLGRTTSGVKLIHMKEENARVASFTIVRENEEEEVAEDVIDEAEEPVQTEAAVPEEESEE